jgi:uncharacterized repeat protein (TIGR03987 family)
MMMLLIPSIVSILAALILYTIGAWSQKITGQLKTWHAVLFWIGFAFDTTGTLLMATIAGRLDFNLHGISGIIAILLMFVNALWATLVLAKKQEAALRNFHKFSIFVWAVWLIPFISGMIGGMRH